MSAHNDPSTHVPDGSFYNFAYAEPAFCANNPRQYYKDVVLECSSLLTPENMLKLEVAASMLDRAFDVRISDVVLIDNIIRQFQENVGDELLTELRIGLDYVNRCASVGEVNSILPVVYNRNLDTRIFWNRMQSHLGMLSASHPMARPLSGSMTRVVKEGDAINMSHYASYLANVAAWMLRPTSPDIGAIHTFSLLLARGSEKDTRRDFDRVNEALAVIAAEHLRSVGFVDNLNTYDCRASFMKPNYHSLLGHCKWDRKIVSLKKPIDRLLSSMTPGRMGLGDIIPLCVDNRLVVEADTGVNVSFDVNRLFVPTLMDFTAVQDDVLQTTQKRTKLFPENGAIFVLDEGSKCGIPMLFARTKMGHPALLLPADDKCIEFLSKLYSVKLPTPMQPLASEGSLLWAYRFDPQQFMAALRQFGKRICYVVRHGTFAVPDLPLVRMECTGTNDLATYMEGKIEATDMFVNEIMLY